jgi:hypothetical protein
VQSEGGIATAVHDLFSIWTYFLIKGAIWQMLQYT